MSASRAQIEAAAFEVERTMRRLGVWTEPPPPLPPFQAPFGMDAMPFEHWIQLVLVPRLREIASSGAPLPPSSNLAGHAVREFDGRDDMHPLVEALRGVDALSPAVPRPAPPAAPMSPFRIINIAGLAAVAGVLVALAASEWAADALRGYWSPTVSAAYTGTIAPSAQHVPLRAVVLSEVDEDGDLHHDQGWLTLHGRGIPQPGNLVAIPEMTFDASKPLAAGTVEDWLAQAGIARAADATAAAEEMATILGIATAARTRADLDDVPSLLPPGTPEPQMLDIAARTPGWFDTAFGLGAAVLATIPLLVLFARRRRRPG